MRKNRMRDEVRVMRIRRTVRASLVLLVMVALLLQLIAPAMAEDIFVAGDAPEEAVYEDTAALTEQVPENVFVTGDMGDDIVIPGQEETYEAIPPLPDIPDEIWTEQASESLAVPEQAISMPEASTEPEAAAAAMPQAELAGAQETVPAQQYATRFHLDGQIEVNAGISESAHLPADTQLRFEQVTDEAVLKRYADLAVAAWEEGEAQSLYGLAFRVYFVSASAGGQVWPENQEPLTLSLRFVDIPDSQMTGFEPDMTYKVVLFSDGENKARILSDSTAAISGADGMPEQFTDAAFVAADFDVVLLAAFVEAEEASDSVEAAAQVSDSETDQADGNGASAEEVKTDEADSEGDSQTEEKTEESFEAAEAEEKTEGSVEAVESGEENEESEKTASSDEEDKESEEAAASDKEDKESEETAASDEEDEKSVDTEESKEAAASDEESEEDPFVGTEEADPFVGEKDADSDLAEDAYGPVKRVGSDEDDFGDLEWEQFDDTEWETEDNFFGDEDVPIDEGEGDVAFDTASTLTITMVTLDETGAEVPTNDVFYVGIFRMDEAGNLMLANTGMSEEDQIVDADLVEFAMDGQSTSADQWVQVFLTHDEAGGIIPEFLYVMETDANGNPVDDSFNYSVSYSTDGAMTFADENGQYLTITNQRKGAAEPTAAPSTEMADLSFTLNLVYTDPVTYETVPYTVTDRTFYITFFTDTALTNRAADPIAMQIASGNSWSRTLRMPEHTTYYLAETDAYGNPILQNNGEFTPEFGDFAEPSYEVYLESTSVTSLYLTNVFNNPPAQPAQPTQAPGNTATLSVTKQYYGTQNAPVNSTATFYAGVFLDKDHTQLASSIVANPILTLSLGGSASVTSSTTVYFSDSNPVTLYVMETNASGVPVDSATFNYTFAMSNSSSVDASIAGAITLSAGNNGSIVIRNTEKAGAQITQAPGATLTPGAVTQLTPGATKVGGVPTGDDTPIALYVILLAIAAGLVVIVVLKRRGRK